MPSEDWVIFVFAPIIVIFGVMLFFPEVAVQFFFFFLSTEHWDHLIATDEFPIFWCGLCAILKYILVKIFHFISLVFYIPIINTSYLPSPPRHDNLFRSSGLLRGLPCVPHLDTGPRAVASLST